MALSLRHVRRWFAVAAIALVLAVIGIAFHARHRMQNALKQVPQKIGIEIQQSASGFTISKSDQGRTIFRIDASKAFQFKQGGRVELHDVVITVYGRDSDRYDRIHGSDFEYNQQTGDVSAKGEVQIDLEANPEGIVKPDQSPPSQLKNAVHLRTSGLVFNQKTGNAYTNEKVEFELPQASGSGLGVNYVAKTNVLTLQSQVKLVGNGPGAPALTAQRAVIAKDPHQVVLEYPKFEMIARNCQAERAILFLSPDNTLDRILASGNVLMQITAPQRAEARADQLEVVMANEGNTVQKAVFSGAVNAQVFGEQPIQANAGRVELDFAADDVLKKVRAESDVKLAQQQRPVNSTNLQNLELTASAIDFFLSADSHLSRAETSGPAQISLLPIPVSAGSQTLVTAGKFDGLFDDAGHLIALHGEPDARITNKNPGQPDRISTSKMMDASFRPGQGIDSIVQQGNVGYVDADRKAWSERARYTPADQVLTLTGSPRVTQGGMATTARSMRLNRASGDAFADGNVKTTYSDLKSEPNGALLASSSPIHVTAGAMTVHGNSAVALYTQDVRLWQDANTVLAPSIQFDRNQRSMLASGTASDPVSTTLVQTDSRGKSTPVVVTSSRLTYTDSQRQAHFDENVTAKGADLTITAKQVDAYLLPRGDHQQAPASSPGELDKIVASGQVAITEPVRHATGDQLVYTAVDDKFVLSGGPPSIFDAEHGKITGVSLTFFRRDDRVLVEGDSKFPTVTKTRVAR
ncbi:MAG TPA: LPS export ABC transporter periplasmic protein LptC [Terriglobales bacterium]|nr:LPS export ABC transporter periplasmic protein LptC [Terriglobales bacterium]